MVYLGYCMQKYNSVVYSYYLIFCSISSSMLSSHSSFFGTAILDKKVQQNPKYKDVKPIVNTGNARRNGDVLSELPKNQAGVHEIFRRLKLSAFVKLVIQIVQNNFADDDALINYDGTRIPVSIPETQGYIEGESLSPFQSVLVGVGEWDRKKEKEKVQAGIVTVQEAKPKPISPYLLLDVRTDDEYKLCHIITAKNYPSSLLSRSVGYETKDLLQYKNISKKLIIFYDEEETLAARVCTTLVQRGYDNVYLLNGGLKLAQEKFPKGLINGTFLPQIPKKRLESSKNGILSPNNTTKQSFKDDFSEDDIRILQLTLDVSFSSTLTKGTKPTSSYAERSKSSQKTCMDFRRRNIEQLQKLQLTTRRACSSATKPLPWK